MNATSIRETFRKLHANGCFLLPNPWDAGSARILAQLGFPALATTSAGLAWSLGRPDNGAKLEEVLAHLRAVVSAVAIPVNADFEDAFAREPEAVAVNVARAAETGVAGLSVEDSTRGAPSGPLYDFSLAVERVRAARESIDRHAPGLVLTARSEGFITGQPDLAETIRRLRAFSEAGADCLYAPGITTADEIRAVVDAVAPKPVNVLVMGPSLTKADLEALGVRRISVGGSLARAAWAGFLDAANEMVEKGTFAQLTRSFPGDSVNARFART